jgi:phosphoribosyl 1,2-cyclic phosphodiesterase
MRFAVLASGSRCNCTYVEVGGTAFLIDCGLSARQAVLRMEALGIDPGSVKFILLTHEHSDHIAGVSTFSRRFKIPVFGNEGTLGAVKNVYGYETFVTGEAIAFATFRAEPFSIIHDAADPVGFRIEGDGMVFAQVTDLGRVTPLVQFMTRGAHALVLESNHDLEMLQNCDYPWELKQRISSTHGHISNDEAGQLLFDIAHSELRYVVLGHISENSNRPDMALAAAWQYLRLAGARAAGIQDLICGSPYTGTAAYRPDADNNRAVAAA